MQLTKVDLTQATKGLATKEDLQEALAPLATNEAVEELARMVNAGFEEIREQLDVRDRITVVERKLQRIEEALNHLTDEIQERQGAGKRSGYEKKRGRGVTPAASPSAT